MATPSNGLGAFKGDGGRVPGGVCHSVDAKSRWIQINDDLETADTANLLKPWAITRSTFHWVQVPDWAGRILIRGRIDLPATTFTTAPVVRLVAAFPEDISPQGIALIQRDGFSGTQTDQNHAEFMWVDTNTANGAGKTLAIASASTTMFIDNTGGFIYTDPPDITGYRVWGGSFVGMLVETAANVTGGASNAVYGEVLFVSA